MNVNDMAYNELVAWVRNNPDAAASKLIVLQLRADTAELRIAAAIFDAEGLELPDQEPSDV